VDWMEHVSDEAYQHGPAAHEHGQMNI